MTMDPVYDDCLMFVLVSNSDVMDNTHGAPVYRWFEVCEEILPMGDVCYAIIEVGKLCPHQGVDCCPVCVEPHTRTLQLVEMTVDGAACYFVVGNDSHERGTRYMQILSYNHIDILRSVPTSEVNLGNGDGVFRLCFDELLWSMPMRGARVEDRAG